LADRNNGLDEKDKEEVLLRCITEMTFHNSNAVADCLEQTSQVASDLKEDLDTVLQRVVQLDKLTVDLNAIRDVITN
jgi:hypothetical protein